jgi:hypothetical protein
MPKEVVQYPDPTKGIAGTELSVFWSKRGENVPDGSDGNVHVVLTNHVWGQLPEPAPGDLVRTVPRHSGGHLDCEACVQRVEAMRAVGTPPEHGGMVEIDGKYVVGEFDMPATVVSKPLTRRQINDLIRELRRARDQAYGKDE